MKPEQQRIAIAEACGWTPHGTINGRLLMWPPMGGDAESPPDYLNDLASMHEAVATLNGARLERFGECLQEVVGIYCVGIVPDYRRHVGNLAKLANATAAQRAEAFLKTLNLWKETEE